MSVRAAITRRQFLHTASGVGAGLTIGFCLPAGCTSRAVGGEFAPNAWLRVGPDERVLVVVDRSEMGQGVVTALPMLLAEELEADWSKVRVEFAPAGQAYFNPFFGAQATGGSSSVRAGWSPLRNAGATAREMLISAAVRTWGVERSECRAERGAVIHVPSKRRLTYGHLAEIAATLPVPRDVVLKDPKDWRILGTRMPRLDTAPKVDGTAQFGIDVKVPGLLVALVARCPVFGGTVASFDAGKAKAVPGVRAVVPISSGVAVVADGYWPAKQGRDELEVIWNEGSNAAQSTASLAAVLARQAERPGVTARNDGDAALALSGAVTHLEAIYETPFLAHATMEPMNCTAHVRPDGIDIWAPTQSQTRTQQLAARIAGVRANRVRVHTTYLGGGFGRRYETDFIQEAVETSKAVGAPVKVIWSREDDLQHDYYRPASYHRLRAGLDGAGWPVAWAHRIVAPSILARALPSAVTHGLDGEAVSGAVGLPYTIPNVHVDYVVADTGIPVGFWRSVNHSFNAFVVESFVDELAALSGKDPYDFRRALLPHAPRHLKVLDLAAMQADWRTPAPRGRSRGIALWKSFDSYNAQVAEVSVQADGTVRVHRVVCAVDCGHAVNPNTIEAQIQSGVVYGLTAALKGAITIDRGRVQQSNFHDYQVLAMKETPLIEVHRIPSDEAPGGVGELGTPAIAPALCNALYAATGKRIRRLPIGKVA